MNEEQISGRNRTITELESEFPILNICDVMDWIYTTFEPGKQSWEMSYEWECEKLKEFCENFDLYLYERPREDFYKWQGIDSALEGGYRGVILSDLS